MLGLAWKSLGWFLAGVAVALGFLLVPLQVAAERKKLDRTVADITRARRDIRALETEFETRGTLAQLDRWNADSLKLVAPAADQFVPDEKALARIDVTGPAHDGAAPQLAFVPSAPAAAFGTPLHVPPPASVPAPAIRTSNLTAMAATTLAPARRRDVALLDRALLDERLLGDLRSGARAEIGAAR